MWYETHFNSSFDLEDFLNFVILGHLNPEGATWDFLGFEPEKKSGSDKPDFFLIYVWNATFFAGCSLEKKSGLLEPEKKFKFKP